MPKLNQIIAVVSGRKSTAHRQLTDIHQRCQKPTLFEGLNRTYTPLDENGETHPPESKRIQYTARRAIHDASEVLEELFNVVTTQDAANQSAAADIVVNDQVIVKNVPVTSLLFLEKQLIDIRKFVDELPVLDPSEDWSWSEQANCYTSPPSTSNRTKKVPRNHVLAEATEHHPAQVQPYQEDVKVGEWKAIKFSGALAARDRDAMIVRINQLQEAVKFAREKANEMEVTVNKTGEAVLDFVFGDLASDTV